MTKWEKKQLMEDLGTLRLIIDKTTEFKYRVLNYPKKPEVTPMTLIARSVRVCRRIKPV